ncbi:MAG: hypothetical protein HKN68_10180 [Saprospiraceae bacterium]|nr:hypothetical protein [Saprospiraceae bacterium]
MKQVLFFLVAAGFLFMYSCQEEFTPEVETNDMEVVVRADQLPNGFGIQKINENQTNEALIRGGGVGIPFFFPNITRELKTGTWATLGFSFNNFIGVGPCPEEVTQEMIDQFFIDVAAFIEATNFELFWDGEELDIMPYFRTDYSSFIYNAEFDECYLNVPWRYYVVPQNKGGHDFFMNLVGNEFYREVVWVPGKK